MELLKSINHNHMCSACNQNNTKCTGCNYTMARHNQLTFKKISKLLKEKNIIVPTLIDLDGRLR